MKKEIYAFSNYKLYMKYWLDSQENQRGQRAQLARFLGCQTGFVSQVVNGEAHFSLEHCYKINEFFSHSVDQEHFFMLLVQMDRAGSSSLKKYYERQIQTILQDREAIKSRIQVQSKIQKEDEVIYFSRWYYSVIHLLTGIPEYQTRQAIADKLKLPLNTVSPCLEFLLSKGLIEEKGGRYRPQLKRIHLDQKSVMLAKHHTNWAFQAIRALENESRTNLHYSGAISLSKEDYFKVREILLKAIENTEQILKDSPEEEIVGLSLNLFML